MALIDLSALRIAEGIVEKPPTFADGLRKRQPYLFAEEQVAATKNEQFDARQAGEAEVDGRLEKSLVTFHRRYAAKLDARTVAYLKAADERPGAPSSDWSKARLQR